jgi:hypothetical protein
MRMFFVQLIAVTISVLGSHVALGDVIQAHLIYSNGGPDSNLPELISDISVNLLAADDFALEEGSNIITDVHWWGVYFDNAVFDDDFTIQILSDISGAPGSEVQSVTDIDVERTATGEQNQLGFDIYQYFICLETPIELTADTRYWLSIYNDGSNSGIWEWSSSLIDGNAYFSEDGGLTWQALAGSEEGVQGLEAAFELTDDCIVPEPSTMLLLGIGLAAIGARKIRSRN